MESDQEASSSEDDFVPVAVAGPFTKFECSSDDGRSPPRLSYPAARSASEAMHLPTKPLARTTSTAKSKKRNGILYRSLDHDTVASNSKSPGVLLRRAGSSVISSNKSYKDLDHTHKSDPCSKGGGQLSSLDRSNASLGKKEHSSCAEWSRSSNTEMAVQLGVSSVLLETSSAGPMPDMLPTVMPVERPPPRSEWVRFRALIFLFLITGFTVATVLTYGSSLECSGRSALPVAGVWGVAMFGVFLLCVVVFAMHLHAAWHYLSPQFPRLDKHAQSVLLARSGSLFPTVNPWLVCVITIISTGVIALGLMRYTCTPTSSSGAILTPT